MLFFTDKDRLLPYQTDESGMFQGQATILYCPQTQTELSQVFQLVKDQAIPITISGGRTGITGACVPVDGGAVISLEKIRQPSTELRDGFEIINGDDFSIYVNINQKRAIVPASVSLTQLDDVLAPLGLLYPPDPTEMTAQLGGTVATNASGARSYFYDSTRKWVQRMSVVLRDGQVLDIARGVHFEKAGALNLEDQFSYQLPDFNQLQISTVKKNTAGFYLRPGMDLIDLFIGSEGKLGCFVDIELELVDRFDDSTTVVVFFDSQKNAIQFVDQCIQNQASFRFLCLEFLDMHSLAFIKDKFSNIPEKTCAVFFEVREQDFEVQFDLISELLDACNMVDDWTIPYEKREEIRLFRHALPESINEFVRQYHGKVGTDMAVPHDKFEEMIDYYDELASASGVVYVKFGHIGDDHIHVNFLPTSLAQLKIAKSIVSLYAKRALLLGGTLSAEHGLGRKTF